MFLIKDFLSIGSLAILAVSCKTPDVKIYQIVNESGGIVRDNGKEVMPFVAAEGYFCMSPPDLRKVVEACQNP